MCYNIYRELRKGADKMKRVLRTRDKVRMILQGIAILLIDIGIIGLFYIFYGGLWLIAGLM